MIFGESTVYAVNESADELIIKHPELEHSEEYASHEVDAENHPDKYQLEIANLDDEDVFVFTSLITEEKAHCQEGYVVVSPNRAVHSDIVEANPGKYASRHLMEKIRAIGAEELIQFSLPKLAEYAFKNIASNNRHS